MHTDGYIEQALDAAADAILRRARLLDANDPEVAHLMRVLVLKLDPTIFQSTKRRTAA